MEKIDFAAVKARVPIDSVLARYGIQTKKRNSTYLVANCPLPSHTSKDSAFSFAINLEKNLWTCHSDSCKKGSGMKGGDCIDLVCLLEGLRTPLDGAKRLVEWFPHLNALGNSENAAKPKPSEPPVSVENKPLAFTLKDINPLHPMIQYKGITVETAKLFGVGFFPGKGSMAGRIVFPLNELIRANGDGTAQVMLVGYAGRTTLEVTAENPKWRLPPIHKTFLYGLERCDPAKMLVITESLWAPLWLYQQGAQAASLMGSDMTEGQERCLEPFGLICVAMDNDAKGKAATETITARLRRNHKVMRATLKEG